MGIKIDTISAGTETPPLQKIGCGTIRDDNARSPRAAAYDSQPYGTTD